MLDFVAHFETFENTGNGTGGDPTSDASAAKRGPAAESASPPGPQLAISGSGFESGISQAALKDWISQKLGFEVKVAVATAPASVDELTPGEKEKLASLNSPIRQIGWLCGRAALKDLLRALGKSEDTSTITFPNSSLSLTHSSKVAVAVGTAAKEAEGLGVDLQIGRSPKLSYAPFFLTQEELAWLGGLQPEVQAHELWRVWTVKEALFKANLCNAGTTLRQYRLCSPEKRSGSAWGPVGENGGGKLRFISFEVEKGFFSLAVKPACARKLIPLEEDA